eukprot:TRINITY_DN8385_c0_g3_i1.p1 TRINITY_DN8385_c0_g3~~TRINITY_DN8385_c0_g3_i1.p1  ORF type:complete len:777 (+),score=70.74 TRINITY_DN8385_c0_g3_i1:148-2478(+)
MESESSPLSFGAMFGHDESPSPHSTYASSASWSSGMSSPSPWHDSRQAQLRAGSPFSSQPTPHAETSLGFRKHALSLHAAFQHLDSKSWSSEARASRAHFWAVTRVVLVWLGTMAICGLPVWRYGFSAVERCDAILLERGASHGPNVANLHWKWLVFGACCGLCLLAMLVSASQIQWWYASKYMTLVRLHVLAAWLIGAVTVLLEMWIWCDLPAELLVTGSNVFKRKYPVSPYRVCWLVLITGNLSFYSWHFELIAKHFRGLEVTFKRRLGSSAIKWTVRFNYALALLLFIVNVTMDRQLHPRAVHIVDGLGNFGPLVSWCLLAVFGSRGFWMSYRFVQQESKKASRANERLAIRRVVARTRAALFELVPNMVAIFLAVSAWYHAIGRLELAHECRFVLINVVALVISSRFAILLSGMNVLEVSWCPQTEDQRRSPSGRRWSSGDEDWDAKVQELALRGFTLQALLDFYWRLGSEELMSHFDSERHTTADVVREAIIPMTRDSEYGDAPLSTILMNGRSVCPNRLVTHSWSNLFSNLVAAIVADALDLPTYDTVLARLTDPQEHAALKAELYWKGSLHQTYWLCALSVNQHSCICDTLHGQTEDSVTHERYQTCTCKSKKYLNHTPPMRVDKQSIPCEVNKFDDMMSFLASVNPKFGQCIAVDGGFDIFRRAWCVAEIHRAYVTDVLQALRLFSTESVKEQQYWLTQLRVEEMQASNPADKTMILAKIDDTTAFNEQLQSLIFSDDGLLRSWRDGVDLASALGLLKQRAEARDGEA